MAQQIITDAVKNLNKNDLPYVNNGFYKGGMVVYNDKIYAFGGQTTLRSFYSWNEENGWVEEGSLPYDFYRGSAVVYNNEIHILGGSVIGTERNHYSWDGVSWTQHGSLPYDFYDGDAVIWSGFSSESTDTIYILGGTGVGSRALFSWRDSTWVGDYNTLPISFTYGMAFVLNGLINILISNKHYRMTSTGWIEVYSGNFLFNNGFVLTRGLYNAQVFIGSTMYSFNYNNNTWTLGGFNPPYTITGGKGVVYNDETYILGGSGNEYAFYKRSSSSWLKLQFYNGDQFEYYYGASVVFNNLIYIICNTNMYVYNKKLDSWTLINDRNPYNFYKGSAVVYDDKIHILGSYNDTTKHYSWDGNSWNEESTLPYSFIRGCAVVYDDKIHIIGTASASTYYRNHYSWDGNEWVEEDSVTYSFGVGCAVVYNNKIHILGSSSSSFGKNHYSWSSEDGWQQELDCPISINTQYPQPIILNGKMHIFYSKSCYMYDGLSWIEETGLSEYPTGSSSSLIDGDNEIHILGGENVSGNKRHYIRYYLINTGINQVIYGEDNLLDLSLDDLSDTLKVEKGIITHDKSGNVLIGTRPKLFKYCSDRFWRLYNNFRWYDGTTIMRLGSYNIKIRVKPSNTAYVQLYTIKSDGVTESAVDLCQPGANFNDSVRVIKVWYITKWCAMFIYRWTTNNDTGVRNGIQQRAISVKADGTIVMGAVVNWSSTADSTTVIGEGAFIPTLVSGGTDFIWCRRVTTISSGAYSIAGYKINNTLSTAVSSYNSSSGTSFSISADVDNYLPPLLFYDVSYPIAARGGFFYKNTSGVDSVFILTNYYDSFRNVTLANAGADIAAVGSTDHYILGLLINGPLLTVKKQVGYYLWTYDHTSTSNMFKLIALISDEEVLGSYSRHNICGYKDNIITYYDGSRKQIVYEDDEWKLIKIMDAAASVGTIYYPEKEYGPESDPINGLFSY